MKISDEEKTEHPEAELIGGYLKESYASKKVQDWWDALPEERDWETIVHDIAKRV